MKNVLSSKILVYNSKSDCYGIMLRGMEAGSLKEDISDRLEVFELWIYRRILKINPGHAIRGDKYLSTMANYYTGKGTRHKAIEKQEDAFLGWTTWYNDTNRVI